MELVELQAAQVAGSDEVLVTLAGVLLVELSHAPHAVVFAAVAITGVGYPVIFVSVHIMNHPHD